MVAQDAFNPFEEDHYQSLYTQVWGRWRGAGLQLGYVGRFREYDEQGGHGGVGRRGLLVGTLLRHSGKSRPDVPTLAPLNSLSLAKV